ncbi:MAG: LLM class F420-dependent oxidoreductase [Candidatus Rokubacteria bacterium]|nr:LLM class F420-dependent oxidoreductase [Candidatus Rokubacteria bacterium]
MKFGLFTGLTGISWPELVALWQHVEATGWDAAFVTDHFMPNLPDPVGDTLECWTSLSGLAMATRKMRIGTLVSGNTYRHPALLAKMATNVDIVSGGRFVCGIGAAWQENEHVRYGIPFHTVRERLARLDEACQVLLALWTQDRVTFRGKYYQLDGAPLFPKPVQKPHPELLVGGGGEHLTLKIVAAYADHWNVWGGPRTLARKGRVLEEHCTRLGRDPDTITRSANMALLLTDKREAIERLVAGFLKRFGWSEELVRDTVLAGSVAQVQETVGRLGEAGVGHLFIPTFLPAWSYEQLDRFITEVAPAFR